MEFHPFITSFPVALIFTITLFEMAYAVTGSKKFSGARSLLLPVFAVSIVAAFLSGYWASEEANQTFKIADDLIGRHEQFGKLLFFLSIPMIAVGILLDYAKRGEKYLMVGFRTLLLVCLILTVLAGRLGGNLVFEHGAGVRATLDAEPE